MPIFKTNTYNKNLRTRGQCHLFLFVIHNNATAFVNMHIFSLIVLNFDISLLLLTVTLRGVSNKHCLLSLFSFF